METAEHVLLECEVLKQMKFSQWSWQPREVDCKTCEGSRAILDTGSIRRVASGQKIGWSFKELLPAFYVQQQQQKFVKKKNK